MNQEHYEESKSVESTPADGGGAERVRGFARDSRRGFLRTLWGAGGISAAASLGLGGMVATPRVAGATGSSPSESNQRRDEALGIRVKAARVHWNDGVVDHPSNGDEHRYPDKRASFFKCLPQNHLGEVDQAAYAQFLKAMRNGDPSELEAIPLALVAVRKLANPQAAFAFDLAGLDSHAIGIPPAPRFASAQKAAEIGEVYWQALTRDIPFTAFKTDHVISAAVEDLNRFSAIQAPTQGKRITANTLFRSGLPGDLIGPYISQFLWLDVPYGPSLIKQRYATPIAGEEFITDYDEWLAIQRGAAPIRSIAFDSEPRYIYNGRGLGQYVATDVSFQAFLNAALIINGIGPSCLDPNNPYLYSANQGGFVTFGAVDLLHMVTMAARLGLEGAWFHKWLVHRGARPEVFAGRIENQLRKRKNYGIHQEILHSEAVDRVRSAYGTALLPQAYPEGSPTHPAYPAGHSAIAGACATVLKAFVDEDFVMPDPVQASSDGRRLRRWGGAPLTLGHEINKLAGNISIGRCTAGVHYRSDGAGLEVGEAMAIGLLQDYSRTYNEYFDGFTLTKFDSRRIHIVDGEVNTL